MPGPQWAPPRGDGPWCHQAAAWEPALQHGAGVSCFLLAGASLPAAPIHLLLEAREGLGARRTLGGSWRRLEHQQPHGAHPRELKIAAGGAYERAATPAPRQSTRLCPLKATCEPHNEWALTMQRLESKWNSYSLSTPLAAKITPACARSAAENIREALGPARASLPSLVVPRPPRLVFNCLRTSAH